jgi:hypothetical protein
MKDNTQPVTGVVAKNYWLVAGGGVLLQNRAILGNRLTEGGLFLIITRLQVDISVCSTLKLN